MAAILEQTIYPQPGEYPKPTFLYKYYKLDKKNEKNVERVQRVFVHDEIYFASPQEFKDPFDCRVQAFFDASDGDWENYLDGMLKDKHPEWDYDKRQTVIGQLIKEGCLKDPGVAHKIVSDVQGMIYKIGVFCLSEVPDDILMWSHYADGHRGFCLQFRIDPGLYPFGVLLFKVDYTPSYPRINIVSDLKEQTRKVLLTKALHWEYEREWRIFDPDKGPGTRVFPAEMLIGVIFGCDMPHESSQLIWEWAKDRKIPLNIYEAGKKETEFGLEIIKTIV